MAPGVWLEPTLVIYRNLAITGLLGADETILDGGHANRGMYSAGEHSVVWRGRDSSGRAVPSGEYFFVVNVDGVVETRKALLLK